MPSAIDIMNGLDAQFLNDPEVAALRASHQGGSVKRGDWTIDVGRDGKVHYKHGSLVKPLIAAGLTAAGGVGLGMLAGGGAAASLGPQAVGAAYPGAGTFGAPATAAATSGAAHTGILSTAAKLFAGQGTGNTALDTAGRVGRGLLGVEADRQAGRQAEAGATQAQDRNAISAAQTNLVAGAHRGAQAVQGDVMAHAQPFEWTTGADGHLGYTGGLSPSLFSDSTRQLGTQLSTDALSAQTADHGSPVNLTPLPKGNALDSILSTAGNISGLMGLIPYKRPQTPVPTGWA